MTGSWSSAPGESQGRSPHPEAEVGVKLQMELRLFLEIFEFRICLTNILQLQRALNVDDINVMLSNIISNDFAVFRSSPPER